MLLRVLRRSRPVLLLPLLLAACSDPVVPDAPVRVSFEFDDEGPEPPVRFKITHSLETGEDLAALTVQGGTAELKTVKSPQIPEARECLELPGVKQVRIHVPGPFDPATVDLLQVELAVVDPATVHVLGIAMIGEESVVSKSADIFLGRRVKGVPVDLAPLERAPRPVDEVIVQVTFVPTETETTPPDLRVFSIRLRDRPRRSWLPPGGEEEMVMIGNESRPAYRLSGRKPLEAKFRVGNHRTLSFSYGTPEVLRLPSAGSGVGSRVRVTLEAGAHHAERDFPLEQEPDEASRWFTAVMPLDGFENRDVSAKFEVLGETEKVLFTAVGRPLLSSPERDPKTVLLITSDTHRSDYIGAAPGGVDVKTPTIDRLISEGVYFEDAYSSANITNPSHIALLTGLHPRDTRIVSNERRLSEAATTLAEVFREAGWMTWAAISVRHLDAPWSGLGQGFDRVTGPTEIERHAAEAIDDVLRWGPEADGRPLFVWLHVFDAHDPYVPSKPYKHMYYPKGRDPMDPALPSADPELEVRGYPGYVDPEYFESMYRGEITYLDEQLDELLSRGRFRNAIVGFTGDHGENLNEGVVPFGHRGLSNATLSVPLVLRYPGVEAGKRITRPVRQIDLGRTLLDLAGLEGTPFPGKNLLDEDAEQGPRFAMEDNYVGASIQLGKWMLVMPLKKAPVYGIMEEDVHRPLLYDNELDPAHENELSATQPEVTASLRNALVEWLAAATPFDLSKAPDVDSEQMAADLAALGYISAEDPNSSVWIDPECDCQNCARFR
jgi:arylsulfatase A-like enzyme